MLPDELLRQMVDAMPMPVAVTDDDNRYVYLNRAYETMFDLRAASAIGRVFDCSSCPNRLRETTVFAAPDGRQLNLHTVHTQVMDRTGDLHALELELRAVRGELARVRETDPVTQALSRRALRAHTDDSIGPSTVGVLRISVDDYESVRSEFGIDVADDLLARFGELIRKNTRPSDVFARIGESEFTLVLREADREQTAAVARRICAATTEARTLSGRAQLALSVTIGAVHSDATDLKLSNLIDQAEAAMQTAPRCRNEAVVV